MADHDQVARLVDAFGGQRLDVVLVARSYWAAAPSAWQQTLQSGLSPTLPDFVAGMDHHTDRVTWGQRWGWETMDPATVLPRWRPALPEDALHLVTVPPPGSDRDLLWARFAHACRIDPGEYSSRASTRNSSLSAEAASLLKLLGPRLRGPGSVDVPAEFIHTYLGQRLLAPHRGSPIELDAGSAELIRQRATASHAALREAGYHVVGDLADLMDEAERPGARAVEDVGAQEQLELALEVIPSMFARIMAERRRADQARAEPAAVPRAPAGSSARSPGRWRRVTRRARATRAGAWAAAARRRGRRLSARLRGR